MIRLQKEEIEATLEDLKMIEEHILCSYSGNIGCMCGCNGSYKYKKSRQLEASASRGYMVHDEECSDRAPKMLYNRIKKAIETKNEYEKVTWHSWSSKEKIEGCFVLDNGTYRTNVLYFLT